ncbi:MAG TPA: XRE family transcriptional regulator [Alphaproteobacteria bacterium]|nr:XRE family transcriptional regulator [Alphaproteobacteria bacterium]
MEIERAASVWESLTDTPEEAANMTMRSQLLLAVGDAVNGWALSQAQAAARLGITQPRLNDLLRGRIGKFSLDALVNLSARAGLTIQLDVRAAGKAAA